MKLKVRFCQLGQILPVFGLHKPRVCPRLCFSSMYIKINPRRGAKKFQKFYRNSGWFFSVIVCLKIFRNLYSWSVFGVFGKQIRIFILDQVMGTERCFSTLVSLVLPRPNMALSVVNNMPELSRNRVKVYFPSSM